MTNKYSKGLIYKICCKDPEISEIYIGSTCNFSSRKSKHRSACRNVSDPKHNLPVYQFIRNCGGFQNWSFIQIEKYATDTKEDLLFRERHWIEQLKPSLNKFKPIVTQLEWKQYFHQNYLENKERIVEKQKIRYENNKESILAYSREYGKRRDVMDRRIVKIECDICSKLISKCNMAKHKRIKHS